jgi:hypothetical protein
MGESLLGLSVVELHKVFLVSPLNQQRTTELRWPLLFDYTLAAARENKTLRRTGKLTASHAIISAIAMGTSLGIDSVAKAVFVASRHKSLYRRASVAIFCDRLLAFVTEYLVDATKKMAVRSAGWVTAQGT